MHSWQSCISLVPPISPPCLLTSSPVRLPQKIFYFFSTSSFFSGQMKTRFTRATLYLFLKCWALRLWWHCRNPFCYWIVLTKSLQALKMAGFWTSPCPKFSSNSLPLCRTHLYHHTLTHGAASARRSWVGNHLAPLSYPQETLNAKSLGEKKPPLLCIHIVSNMYCILYAFTFHTTAS